MVASFQQTNNFQQKQHKIIIGTATKANYSNELENKWYKQSRDCSIRCRIRQKTVMLNMAVSKYLTIIYYIFTVL